MSTRKIFFNTVLQSFGKVISLAIGFVNILLLTRYLAEAGFGDYNTIIAYMGFFGVLADLGLYLITTQLISKEGADEKKILGNIFSLRLFTVLLTLLIGAVIAIFLPYSATVKIAMFIAIGNFAFVSATQVLVGVFQKHLIFYKLVASEIVGRIVGLGLTILFITRGLGLEWFIVALLLASAVHFIISLKMARRRVAFKLRFEFGYWKSILAQSWPLGLSVVSNLIYFKTDTIILSLFHPARDVGIYSAGYRFFEVLINFPAMFAGLIMPFLARYAYKHWDKYKLYLQKSLDALILLIVPMTLTVLFFARQIIDLIAGTDGFSGAENVLKILIIAAAITYMGQLLGYTVVALNVQRKMMWGYILGAILGTALYFTLIPKFSYLGAAMATVVVETVVFIYAYILTSRHTNFFPVFTIAGKAFLAAIPMGLFYYFINFQFFLPGAPTVIGSTASWVIEILIGLGIYTVLLFVFKAIPKNFLRQLLSKETPVVPVK